jgi:hypothetical protein
VASTEAAEGRATAAKAKPKLTEATPTAAA